MEPRFCYQMQMRSEKMPAVYIMANRHRGTLYTGVTSDLGKRVLEHKDGSTGGFTMKYGVKTLVWYENHPDMASAILRETRIKNWRRQWKIDLIESINPDWKDLSIVYRPADDPKAGFHIERSRSPAADTRSSGMTDLDGMIAKERPSFQTRPGSAEQIREGAIWNPAFDGLRYYPQFFDCLTQQSLLAELRHAVTVAPLFQPVMPRTGRPFSVKMTNLGPLGWVSDRKGYRYQAMHPETGNPWPPIPTIVMDVWRQVSNYPHDPEACLVNFYAGGAKMGLHQDKDEEDFAAPVVSISLGDTAVFRIGGVERGGKTETIKLASGDVLVMGGPSRLRHHGVDRVLSGTSTLLKDGGRINLTLRRVTEAN